MNTLFVLFATLHLDGGHELSYAMHTDLTGEECIFAMTDLQPFVANNVTLSCEFDHALPIDAE